MLLAFSQSLFETSPESYPTDAQKVHHVAEQLKGKARQWYAKSTLKGEKLLDSYSTFCENLLLAISPSFSHKELHNQFSNLYQGRMATSDFIEEFTRLKNAIGMANDEACYLLQKHLSPDLKSFLAHHILPNRYEELVKEILQWSPCVKQLPSWKLSNPKTASIKVSSEVPPGLVPKAGGGFQLSDNEPKRRIDEGCCLYCGKKGHQAKDCFALNQVQQNSSAVLAASDPNKSVSQSYASLPVTLHWGSQIIQTLALLDTGTMGNFLDTSLLDALKISDVKSSKVLLANKSPI